ncbi:Com family DNA-binding transcriptional regulator [Marinomonas piezotolerans]|uniref:Com family DNA-binding transcriptional regulator n=1 Tax=Marinomonas piezotolerans TaxID=2213058 RepID=A0A370UA90_9GAMM|nr:Com family DNA-binding transcriptional regulator [Marinomonas piezotolerans]RDL44702.1 Com family DNA-binding transcriptional regulator [Marinomonas piezotolerans]
MQNLRCKRCNKLLAKGAFAYIEIKCPRCKLLNASTTSANCGVPDRGKTNHS